jgi:hypothetical protein
VTVLRIGPYSLNISVRTVEVHRFYLGTASRCETLRSAGGQDPSGVETVCTALVFHAGVGLLRICVPMP